MRHHAYAMVQSAQEQVAVPDAVIDSAVETAEDTSEGEVPQLKQGTWRERTRLTDYTTDVEQF